MDNIKVIIWGYGAMGRGMADMLMDKKGVDIVGVIDLDKTIVGKPFNHVIGRPGMPGVCIRSDAMKVLSEQKADVVLLATDSFVKGAFDKIMTVVSYGMNVISTAEEMAYPKAGYPEESKAMDEAAKANGVSVLGTGINPGFIMDLLVVALSGVMKDVTKIEAGRVNSLSPFGPAVMHEQGVGLTPEQYVNRKADGTLAGHVGFRESVHMIADALGIPIDRFESEMEPIITDKDRKSLYGQAKAGTLAGIRMTGRGISKGKTVIDMVHPQQIEPQVAGIATEDTIRLSGHPSVNMSISPEIDGGLGTIAMCVNMIPHVINARPGLRTMIDLPVPRAIMGDMRDLLDRD